MATRVKFHTCISPPSSRGTRHSFLPCIACFCQEQPTEPVHPLLSLVYLGDLVCLVYLVQRVKETTQTLNQRYRPSLASSAHLALLAPLPQPDKPNKNITKHPGPASHRISRIWLIPKNDSHFTSDASRRLHPLLGSGDEPRTSLRVFSSRNVYPLRTKGV